MSTPRDRALGYTPAMARPVFRRPPAAFEAPPEPQGRQDRDIARDTSKELVYKSTFTIQSGGAWGTFSQENVYASLEKPHNAVDVFLSITNPTALATVTNGSLEIAGTVYAWGGGARGVVGRGAYLIDAASPTAVDQYIYLCSARVAAERFDVSLRVAGPFTDNGGQVQGQIALVGYETGAPNAMRSRTALQCARAATVYSGTTVARAAALHGAVVTNANTTAQFLQFFDDGTTGEAPGSAAARLAGDQALAQFYIPGSSSIVLDFGDEPILFGSGIVWQASTTSGTNTAGSALSVALRYA